MAQVNVYINYNGNCEEAFDFYKSVFGKEFSYIGRFGEMPAQEGMPPMPSEMANKIMHVSLPISAETCLMGSDVGGEWAPNYIQGNNFAVSITANSKEEADTLFSGLSEGGMVTMPLETMFWGDYFGMFTDKFGIGWMISFNTNPQQM
jgi:PhnB protein